MYHIHFHQVKHKELDYPQSSPVVVAELNAGALPTFTEHHFLVPYRIMPRQFTFCTDIDDLATLWNDMVNGVLHSLCLFTQNFMRRNSLLRGQRGLWYTFLRLRKKGMIKTFKFAWHYYFGFTAGAVRAF